MRIVVWRLLGLVFGAIAGALIGVGLGLIWIAAFQTSCFEGACGMLVFFGFMPLGLVLGALTGAVGLGYIVSRRRPAAG